MQTHVPPLIEKGNNTVNWQLGVQTLNLSANHHANIVEIQMKKIRDATSITAHNVTLNWCNFL